MATFTRRHLPHLHAVERAVFITWRLHGSLPAGRFFPPAKTTESGKVFVAMDFILDRAASGPLHLSRPEIANLVVDAIRYGQDHMHHYEHHAYVIMANHVHLLITPLVDLPKITHSLKRVTARRANDLLGLTGRFWQEESYDHLVREEREFERIVRYIENNPVRAGLVTAAHEFSWSSAGRPIENRPAG